MKNLPQKFGKTTVDLKLILSALSAWRKPVNLRVKLYFVTFINLVILTVMSSPVGAQIQEIRALLPQLRRETNVRIFVPRDLTLPGPRIYVDGQGDANGYRINLGTHPQCRANACFTGLLSATRGESPPADFKQVPLSRGITGYYFAHPRRISILYWVYDGVLYGIQLKVDEETVIDIANSAIEETLGN